MYKTIRHGENSLQYTILPQNDDIRIDGKLTSASSNSINNKKGNIGHRNKRGNGKNKSFYAYLGLLFVCTVIIGAILIPFFVSADCIPNPSDWFLKTKVAFSGHNSNNNSNNKTNKISKIYNSNFNSTTSTTLPTNTAPTLSDNNNIKINNSNQYTDSTTNKAYPNENEIELGLHNDNPTTIRSTTNLDDKNDFNNLIVNKLILNNNHNDAYKIVNDIQAPDNDENNNSNNINQNTKYSSVSRESSISTEQNDKKSEIKFDDSVHPINIPFKIIVTTTAASYSLTELSTERTTEKTIINNNSTRKRLLPPLPPIPITKKPIILPVLPKTDSKENGLIIPTEHKETKNWIKSHWPFIDPSTYFQWAGYKSEDSVLLPAILGITLIGIILILFLCLVARNKRTIVASVRKRNRNDIDETGEDNATLLTTANLSDIDDE